MKRPLLLSFVLLSVASWAQEPPKAAPTPASLDSILANLTPRQLGPTTMGGRIADLAVYDKEPRIFYVASASGGVWKTTNGGITFSSAFEKEGTGSVGAVAVCQSNPDIVYVGTGEASSRNSVAWGDGVYKSVDGGKSWTHVGLVETRQISRIQIDPRNPDVVYVAAQGRLWGMNPERGVFKTTDGGKSWKQVLSVDDRTGATDLQMDPKHPDTLLCAMWERIRKPYDFTSGGPGSGLFRTTDGGRNWHRVTRGLPAGNMGRIGISYFDKDPRIVIATIEYKPTADEAKDQKTEDTKKKDTKTPQPPQRQVAFNGGGLFRSKDGGETWEHINNLNPRPFYFSRPQQDPQDVNRIYIPAISFHYSEDGGKTFKAQRQNIHVDFHAIWVDPSDSNHIIVGEDGGVGQTRDRGLTWEHLNNLPIGQFYAVAFDYRKPYWVYGGLQDNGSWAFPTQTVKGGPAFWDALSVGGGDGFHVQVDPTDPTTVYSESQGGAITRLDEKTGQSKFIRPRGALSEALRFNWSTPFIISPHNPRTLYLGGNKLFKTVNRGDTWQPVSPDLTTNDPTKQRPGKESVTPEDTGAERYCTIITISESPLKQGLLYVGTDDGQVQVSTNDGQTWSNLTSNIPDLPPFTWCSRVVASKWSEGRVYATFDGHRGNDFQPYVYVSEDYGKTWSKLNAGLPDYDCIYVIREGDRNPDLLYLGSEESLRISLDRGRTWARYRTGFPTVAVHDLAVHPRDLDLVIGTHGRSIWTLDVSGLEQLTADALAKDVAVFQPQNVLRLGFVDDLGWAGDRNYQSKNTQPGTNIQYYLRKDAADDPKVTVSDVTGTKTRELTGVRKAGLNVVRWDGRIGGRLADAGDYRVTLTVSGKEYLTSVRVEDAPLIDR